MILLNYKNQKTSLCFKNIPKFSELVFWIWVFIYPKNYVYKDILQFLIIDLLRKIQKALGHSDISNT